MLVTYLVFYSNNNVLHLTFSSVIIASFSYQLFSLHHIFILTYNYYIIRKLIITNAVSWLPMIVSLTIVTKILFENIRYNFFKCYKKYKTLKVNKFTT